MVSTEIGSARMLRTSLQRGYIGMVSTQAIAHNGNILNTTLGDHTRQLLRGPTEVRVQPEVYIRCGEFRGKLRALRCGGACSVCYTTCSFARRTQHCNI